VYLPYPFLYSLAPDAKGSTQVSVAEEQIGRLFAAASRSGRRVARRAPTQVVLRPVAGPPFK
jgi:hypothetical protein